MAIRILMPALSPTMEEGTLAKWLVKEGDTVNSGDIIAEIETDKATMEFEVTEEGTIGELLVAEGSVGIHVNSPIAILVEEEESSSTARTNLSGSDAQPELNHMAELRATSITPAVQKVQEAIGPVPFGVEWPKGTLTKQQSV